MANGSVHRHGPGHGQVLRRRRSGSCVITGRGKDALDAAAAEIGRNVTGVQGDVANLNDLDRLYEAVKSRYRQIDVIFANAGV